MYEEFEVDSNDIEAAHPIEKKIVDKEIFRRDICMFF